MKGGNKVTTMFLLTLETNHPSLLCLLILFLSSCSPPHCSLSQETLAENNGDNNVLWLSSSFLSLLAVVMNYSKHDHEAGTLQSFKWKQKLRPWMDDFWSNQANSSSLSRARPCNHDILTLSKQHTEKAEYRRASCTQQVWMAFKSSSYERQSIPLWTEMSFIQPIHNSVGYSWTFLLHHTKQPHNFIIKRPLVTNTC